VADINFGQNNSKQLKNMVLRGKLGRLLDKAELKYRMLDKYGSKLCDKSKTEAAHLKTRMLRADFVRACRSVENRNVKHHATCAFITFDQPEAYVERGRCCCRCYY
jgi:hypothetical protein